MKIYILILSFLLILPTITWAAQINMSIDKTEISIDDVLEIRLSVDGVLDNGQIGIQGLEKFNIVGQSSSQQIQIINGKTTSVQEKVLNIQPKQSGDFKIQALGKENGKIIESPELEIKVQKSLVQATKEKLLASSSDNSDQKNTENIKNLLTQPTQQTALNTSQELQQKKISEIPLVQHFSAFNKLFWLEFLSIIVLLGIIFRGILFFREKTYHENK